jgi:cell division protein FtsL
MPTEQPGEVHHHKPRHLAERFENLLGVLMVVAVVLLAVGLIYGMMTAGPSEPSWMR